MYAYYGVFKKVTAIKGEHADMYIVYKSAKGDYGDSDVPMAEVEKYLADKAGITSPGSGIGVYFDKPGSVSANEQRFIAGYIVTENEYNAVISSDHGIQKAYFPAFEAVYAAFPYKSVISFFIAPDKVYTAINEYNKKHSIKLNASIEIYDRAGKLIHAYMPTDISYEEIEKIFNVQSR